MATSTLDRLRIVLECMARRGTCVLTDDLVAEIDKAWGAEYAKHGRLSAPSQKWRCRSVQQVGGILDMGRRKGTVQQMGYLMEYDRETRQWTVVAPKSASRKSHDSVNVLRAIRAEADAAIARIEAMIAASRS